jgi:hypothetical protein
MLSEVRLRKAGEKAVALSPNNAEVLYEFGIRLALILIRICRVKALPSGLKT